MTADRRCVIESDLAHWGSGAVPDGLLRSELAAAAAALREALAELDIKQREFAEAVLELVELDS